VNAGTDTKHQSLLPWPNVLGPRPGLKEINVVCWALFCLCVVAPTVMVFCMRLQAGTLSVDFVYFYGIGQIAKTHPAIDVYDYQLQQEVFNKIQPLQDGFYGPSPYPPFVSQFFRLFADLSFEYAFLLWAAISLTLYFAGIMLALKAFLPDDRLTRSLILCFALAFSPFLLNTLGNGQLSSIGFFFMVLVLLGEKASRPILSGLALSVLIYKPTLLLIVVPMLVITRRFKALMGLTAGASMLILIATFLGGIRIWPAYLHFLNSFGRTSGVYGQSSLRLWKYVDLNSFSFAVRDGRSMIALTFLACFVIAVAIWVGVAWWKSAGVDNPRQSLAWAVAISWTMLVNVYSPIYDSILIVIAIIISLSALRELKWMRAREWVVLLAVFMFAIAWITEPFAKRYGVQLLTLALLAFAITMTYLLQSANRTIPESATVVPVTI
jgi:Glycosyltransferase family 87